MDLGMDIVEADALLKAAGFSQKYEAVDVRWPENVPVFSQQVVYLFGLQEGTGPAVVAVGARDRSVTPSV